MCACTGTTERLEDIFGFNRIVTIRESVARFGGGTFTHSWPNSPTALNEIKAFFIWFKMQFEATGRQ